MKRKKRVMVGLLFAMLLAISAAPTVYASPETDNTNLGTSEKTLISSVELTIDAPEAGKELAQTVTCDTTGVAAIAAEDIVWTTEGEPVTGTAGYHTTYKLRLTLSAEEAYAFSSSTKVNIESQNADVTYDDASEKLIVMFTYPATRKAKLTGITQLSTLNVANGTALSKIVNYLLPGTVFITTEDSNIRFAPVSWDSTTFAEGSYDPSLLTAQSFKLNGTLDLNRIYVETDTVPNLIQITVNVTAAGVVAVPSADVAEGSYAEDKTVTLSTATEGAEIYYTLDGSEPTTSSEKYTAPIELTGIEGESKTVTIKAVAVKAKMQDSPVTTLRYVIRIPAKYDITVTSDGNGTAAASQTSAKAGTEITLETTAATGYQFKEWQVIKGSITISGNSFMMPAEEVNVKAVFEAITGEDDEDIDDDNDSDGDDRTYEFITNKPAKNPGVQNVGSEKQYVKENGTVARSEWVQQNGTWYYAGADGNLKRGWLQTEDGVWYFLNPDGSMHTGWKLVDGSWYFLNPDGSMHTGWKLVDGSWYFLNPDGSMHTGWKLVDGSWYFLNPDGSMHTGWKLVDGSWYFLKADGSMAVGWYCVNGIWYYLTGNGACLMNGLTPDGYWVDETGAWIP